jgi:hypothetical protein
MVRREDDLGPGCVEQLPDLGGQGGSLRGEERGELLCLGVEGLDLRDEAVARKLFVSAATSLAESFAVSRGKFPADASGWIPWSCR